MKKSLTLGSGLLLLAVLVLPVWAAESAVINATVSTEEISVLLSRTSVEYGTLPLGSDNAVPTDDSSIVVTNNGSVNENFSFRGADATSGGTTWTLSAVKGADEYVHKVCVGSADPPSPCATLTTANNELAADIAPSSAVNLRPRLTMPTSTSGYGTFATTVTVVATEHL